MPKKRKKITLDASGIYYKEFNEMIRAHVVKGATDFVLNNVNGHRYIADGLSGDLTFVINGVPGQDLAAFTQVRHIRVNANAQDGVGNTMDEGTIVVDGLAGDVIGYAMRGGRIYIRTDVGYRVGIHMKAYMDKVPTIVVGGKSGDFLGEYMAGGIILLLGMFSDKPKAPITGRSLGTGMHGGVIYVRGEVPEEQLGFGLHARPCDASDMKTVTKIVKDYAKEFDLDVEEILAQGFVKVRPFSHRPYGNMYVHC